MSLISRLIEFEREIGATRKGALSVVVQLTETAQQNGLPLDPDTLKTEKEGQVAGLGGGRLRRILASYGIDRQLSAEAGRTSRGSMETMQLYISFLNALHSDGLAELEKIQEFWIERVKAFFDREPFKIKFDSSLSFRAVIRGLLEQAVERQREGAGMTTLGTVMQHLVGAKLEVAMAPHDVEILHHGANVSDAQGRGGDFDINDLSVHVTGSPSEGLAIKCRDNLTGGRRPIIVTTDNSLSYAVAVCERYGIADRVDIFEIEQFLATNVYELGLFDEKAQKVTVEQIFSVYNRIIDDHEHTPSLKVEIG